MDLLGNYSSDDDDSNSERSRTPPTPIKKTAVHPGTIAPSVTSPRKPAAQKSVASSGSKDVTTRGKKLMSLHSVLPPHILEQLTKSEATGSYEDNSDSEDEERAKETRKQPAVKKTVASQDEGISNFLNALSSAQPTNSSSANFIKPTSSKSNNIQTTSKLGSAFVSATTTTTIRKKDGKTTVREEGPTTPTGESSQSHQSSPSHYKPLSLSPRTAFQPFRSANVSAAPPVPMGSSSYASSERAAAPTNFAIHALRPSVAAAAVAAPHPPPPTQQHVAAGYPNPTEEDYGQQYSNKRSKKRQLQKALRAGQLDTEALNHQSVTQIEQAQPNAYIPREETYAVPAHGVKVVPTEMYNPSVGGNVQADLGKVKGKNQINQLMASAAQLELQQARRGGSKVNSQRAGAKRKYGW